MGHISTMLELWLERGVGGAKRKSKFRTTKEPEKVVAADLVFQQGIQRLQSQPGQAVQSFEERFPSSREFDQPNGTYLMDAGQLLSVNEWEKILPGVEAFTSNLPEQYAGWDERLSEPYNNKSSDNGLLQVIVAHVCVVLAGWLACWQLEV